MAATLVSDHWERGDPYEQYVGRWSRQLAPRFLSWLNLAPGLRWLDIGCGTGALSAAVLDRCSPALVVAVEPSEGFLEKAREALAGKAQVQRGRAEAIPLSDAAVDATVSGLVLNFVPNLAAALGEMQRVTAPGGVIGAYVWDYAGKMELMRHFWDAAVELDPAAAALDEGIRFPLCRPQALTEAFAEAGLREVDATAIDIATPFATFDAYWGPFLGGQGPAPAYAMALSEDARSRLRERLRERVPTQTDGSIALTARAWAVKGTTAASQR